MPSSFELFAACQPGLEPLLAAELAALEIAARPAAGGVAFAGDARVAMRACLWLGTASHVLLRLAEFRCRALGELERKAVELPWRAWLRRDVPLDVRATSRASRVFHTGAVAERIESAIATALGAPLRASTESDAEVARVQVRFARDVCTISLDATSTPLHRRGYRLEGAKAPLREDLAHALVLASGWTRAEALLDPFCGSGTIAIEAAALARGLAPGRLRPPPLAQLALFDERAWGALAVPAAAPAATPPIAASDRDAGAIAAAQANAARAGVAGEITFTHCAVTKQPWLEQPASAPERGVLATNPPYGRRISESRKLETLYQALGHRAGRLSPGWRVALLAHDVRLARRSALPLHAAFTTKHGGLTVTALIGEARTAKPAE